MYVGLGGSEFFSGWVGWRLAVLPKSRAIDDGTMVCKPESSMCEVGRMLR